MQEMKNSATAEPTVVFFLRRGRDSNPRYRFKPVQRFSKPALSATQAPLLSSLPLGRTNSSFNKRYCHPERSEGSKSTISCKKSQKTNPKFRLNCLEFEIYPDSYRDVIYPVTWLPVVLFAEVP